MVRIFAHITRLFVVGACSVMILAMALPHHHGESETACINPFHCSGGEATDQSGCSHRQSHRHMGNDCCGDNHRHHDRQDTCDLTAPDVMQPEREGFSVQMPPLPVAQALDVFIAVCCHEQGQGDYHTALDRSEEIVRRGDLPLHTTYQATAIPARAPSFSVL